jgi:predicted flavoprotein YhiN
MLTRGGVALKELNAQTLAARRISNLTCIGEVVDVDAPCGGYNLTWAFASGFLAAQAINAKA